MTDPTGQLAPCYAGECATKGVYCDGVRCVRTYGAPVRVRPGSFSPDESTAYVTRLPIADDVRAWFDGRAGGKPD